MANDLINKTSIKTLNKGVQRASGMVNAPRRVVNPKLQRDRSSCDQDPSEPCAMDFFIWLFISVLYDEQVMVSKLFPWVLWAIIANYETWGGGCGSTNLQPYRTEVWIIWGLITCNWHLMWEAVSWDWNLNLWGLHWFWVVSVRIA